MARTDLLQKKLDEKKEEIDALQKQVNVFAFGTREDYWDEETGREQKGTPLPSPFTTSTGSLVLTLSNLTSGEVDIYKKQYQAQLNQARTESENIQTELSIEKQKEDLEKMQAQMLAQQQTFFHSQPGGTGTLDIGQQQPTVQPEPTYDHSVQSGLDNSLTQDVYVPPVVTTVQEPEQQELAPILQCADVYRWENGNVSRSTGQFTLSQIQVYISQGLMIRQCNTTRPTDQEVKDHYGIVSTSDIPPPEIPTDQPSTDIISDPAPPPAPPTTKSVPPTVTVTPGEPTNFGMAGILFAGVLALPILAGLGKWK